MRRWRVGRVVALAAVVSVVFAAPAAADAPEPGDYTSRVTSISPDVDGVRAEVVGGDSFLQLTVEPGVEVVVEGYEGEPYLRFYADGTVVQNANSPATYLNEDRFAAVVVPAAVADADPTAVEPDWVPVGDGGRYAWHDHRMHWMAPGAPPGVARGGAFDWNGPVVLTVDGTRVEVDGTIDYVADVSPLPWLAAALIGGVGATALLGTRLRIALVAAGVVAVAAVVVASGTRAAVPAGVGASPFPLAVAALAAVIAVATVLGPDRHRPIGALAVASILGAWGALRFGVLTNPVLPTDVPAGVDRAATAAALAVAGLVAGVALRRGIPPAEASS